MATKLLYLDDFDVLACSATVTVGQTEDGRVDVQLDQTCFYPRGGGQDWDEGHISNSSGADLAVTEVRLDEAGVVHHIGEQSGGEISVGEQVEAKVDQERRSINTRLHSAGHIVDMAVSQLGYAWIPGRGAHYPHMSFVEYEANGQEPAETTASEILAKVTELLATNYENKLMFVPVEEMGKYCRHVPPNIPTNKPARIVLYGDDFGVPCGGTHVRRSSDIGEIVITKVKSKKGLVKVSYVITGINDQEVAA